MSAAKAKPHRKSGSTSRNRLAVSAAHGRRAAGAGTRPRRKRSVEPVTAADTDAPAGPSPAVAVEQAQQPNHGEVSSAGEREPPPDPLRRLRHWMEAVPEAEVASAAAFLAETKQRVGASLRRGSMLPDRHFHALQLLLARQLRTVCAEHDLLVDALVFTDRMRTAKGVTPIRNARLGLRASVELARERGVTAETVAAIDRLTK